MTQDLSRKSPLFRVRSTLSVAGIMALLFAGGLGCSGDTSGSSAGAGSTTSSSSGSAGAGGTTSKGGSTTSSSASGGQSSGGAKASGGSGGTSSSSTESSASGGSSKATGGSTGTGGTTKAGTGTGTGGTTAGSTATGGATSSGGKASTGGSSDSGTGTGGAGTGGSTGKGGTTTGGQSGGATGGSSSSAAGSTGTSNSGPPMGWASWNTFAAKINYNVIKAQADAMVSSGLKAAGYEYVNIDEGWWQGTRDASGNITIDTAEWPGGMSAIADYIHGLGLKAGIYTDAGKDGCGYYYPTGRPAAPGSGSEGHYEQDFLAFSKWGFDFVKVDWCGGSQEKKDAKTLYTQISDAIKKATAQTGRPMVLSVCEWGSNSPWNWAPAISTMWRTSADIIYYGDQADMKRVLTNFDSSLHPSAQTPGHYNDPDMLIVGMKSFTLAQNRTHMALWAIAGAPLLAGNDIATMSADTKSVLTNKEVIAIDQDPLAKQGTKVSDSNGLQVYSKVLSGTGKRAVLLLNRGTAAGTITVKFADIGLGTTATVRDLWAGTDLGSKSTSYAANVPSMDSVFLLITDAPTP